MIVLLSKVIGVTFKKPLFKGLVYYIFLQYSHKKHITLSQNQILNVYNYFILIVTHFFIVLEEKDLKRHKYF